MLYKSALYGLSERLREAAEAIPPDRVKGLVDALCKAERIFVYATGRSAKALQALAIRLVQLELPTFVVGETAVPRIKAGDLFLAVSGSGETETVVLFARRAKAAGARVAAVTARSDSRLAKRADLVVLLPGRTKLDSPDQDKRFLLPLASEFEAVVWAFLDGVVLELMRRLGKDEEALRQAHNLFE